MFRFFTRNKQERARERARTDDDMRASNRLVIFPLECHGGKERDRKIDSRFKSPRAPFTGATTLPVNNRLWHDVMSKESSLLSGSFIEFSFLRL